ncbi:unnamed protein product [Dimorphilus gyrociliatus]|uniref:G-protein coupled receptors family 1 profile domain-containing protein n=1 Tax=Dimorphilus gyrociliatus TaxID=2664684 RepID=A0A7I8WCX7_9ANNE|nr:unnamed protein product [Dimorphilus gyrociliatus]
MENYSYPGSNATLRGATIVENYISAVVQIVGMIFNVIAFLVLCRKSHRHLSANVYLAFIAICDFFCLLSKAIHTYDATFTPFKCYAAHILADFSIPSSEVLICVVTAERVWIVYKPLSLQLFTSKKAVFVSLLTMALFTIVYVTPTVVHIKITDRECTTEGVLDWLVYLHISLYIFCYIFLLIGHSIIIKSLGCYPSTSRKNWKEKNSVVVLGMKERQSMLRGRKMQVKSTSLKESQARNVIQKDIFI